MGVCELKEAAGEVLPGTGFLMGGFKPPFMTMVDMTAACDELEVVGGSRIVLACSATNNGRGELRGSRASSATKARGYKAANKSEVRWMLARVSE